MLLYALSRTMLIWFNASCAMLLFYRSDKQMLRCLAGIWFVNMCAWSNANRVPMKSFSLFELSFQLLFHSVMFVNHFFFWCVRVNAIWLKNTRETLSVAAYWCVLAKSNVASIILNGWTIPTLWINICVRVCGKNQ